MYEKKTFTLSIIKTCGAFMKRVGALRRRSGPNGTLAVKQVQSICFKLLLKDQETTDSLEPRKIWW